MSKNNGSTRRSFLQTSAMLGASLAMPAIVPSRVLGATPPSDSVTIAHIGCGWRGRELMMQTIRQNDVKIAALCDLDLNFLMKRMQFFDDQYGIDRQWLKGEGWDTVYQPTPEGGVDPYLDYRKVLDRKDIDAVVIAVPDHWHAKLYIDAMQAGKDVYGEKPISLTIDQGRKIVRSQAETGQIFQTGMQQRSWDLFRKATEYVRNGRLGKINQIRIVISGTKVVDPVPDEPAPPGLNWERWLGPAPLVPYNVRRSHVTFRWFWDYSGGQVTDLGVHHGDIAQWMLDMDGKGPKTIEGTTETKPGAYETFNEFNLKCTYENGSVLSFESGPGFDMHIEGEKGSIFVNRSEIRSDPADLLNEPLKQGDWKLPQLEDNETGAHIRNFIDCVKSRQQPICPPEIGHRSATVSHLANICGRIGRKLEWDYEKELFVNDTEANGWLNRPEREPYDL
ncbi:MAG: twin-arginine translocation signal domain-containing protein [bacterium]|nr:twin-arginine translocation signal domain-containing protein [bacterium]